MYIFVSFQDVCLPAEEDREKLSLIKRQPHNKLGVVKPSHKLLFVLWLETFPSYFALSLQ